jgi:hypothetical protein
MNDELKELKDEFKAHALQDRDSFATLALQQENNHDANVVRLGEISFDLKDIKRDVKEAVIQSTKTNGSVAKHEATINEILLREAERKGEMKLIRTIGVPVTIAVVIQIILMLLNLRG